MESIGQHPSIVELLGQDRVDHVLIMELGNADLYKVVKKMKFPKPKGGSVKITYPFVFQRG